MVGRKQRTNIEGEKIMKLWVCGQYRSGKIKNVVWDLSGVFSSKKKAISACKDKTYFIGPIELDKQSPDETVVWSDVEYPLNDV